MTATATVTVHPANDAGVVRTDVETTATYTGRGEFYSGLKTGDRVSVVIASYAHTDGTVSEYVSVSRGGAWLSAKRSDLALD